MLGTLTDEKKLDWKTSIMSLVHSYNCTRNFATGFSPYFLLFGCQPRLPIDVEMGLQPPQTTSFATKSQYVKTLRTRLNWAHKKVAEVQQKESARAK